MAVLLNLKMYVIAYYLFGVEDVADDLYRACTCWPVVTQLDEQWTYSMSR